MKRKNVITMLIVLNCTIALTLGGCGGAEVSETGSASKSAITYDKGAESDKANEAKDKIDKDDTSDKADKTDKTSKETKTTDKTDKENKTADKDTSVKAASAKSSTKSNTSASNSSKSSSGNSNKSNSGNKSVNSSKPSSGNSSKPSSGSNSKPSSGNSSKPSSGNSSKPSSGSNSKPSSGSSSKPSSGSSSKPSSGNSKPAHTHSYSSKVTKQPTCSTAGTRTYTCSCGRSYTESIPATGNHKWKDQYELQKIPAQTHEEPYTVWICNGCNTEFTNSKDISRHVMAVFGDACSSYTPTVRYETVIDAPAREENVYVGAKCETCGAWK